MAVMYTTYFILLLFTMAHGNEDDDSSKLLICLMNPTPRRNDIGNFTPEELDPHLCTHIIYITAFPDCLTHDIEPYHSIDLYDNGGLRMFNRTMKLKEANPQLKVILDVYCFGNDFWDNSTKSHDLIISTFIENTITYLERYGFDGLFLILTRHPKELQLLRGLRAEFDKRGFLLFTSTFSFDSHDINYSEISPEYAEVLDKIIVGIELVSERQKTQIYSPLRTLRNVISNYKQHGIPSQKLVPAIPTFALIFKLDNASDTGLSAPIHSEGEEGQVHPIKKLLYYSELMYKINNASEGWVLQRDNETGMLYGHSNSLLWTSFEDPVSVRAKAQFVLEENLPGLAILKLEMDDTMAYNDEGVKFLLTRTAHDALRRN